MTDKNLLVYYATTYINDMIQDILDWDKGHFALVIDREGIEWLVDTIHHIVNDIVVDTDNPYDDVKLAIEKYLAKQR